MKAFLSIVLGLMLLTSLVGISYATPIMQPAGDPINSCVNLSPNDPNYITLGCAGAAHQGGDDNHRQRCSVTGQKSSDGTCCAGTGITPHSLEIIDIYADFPTCEQ